MSSEHYKIDSKDENKRREEYMKRFQEEHPHPSEITFIKPKKEDKSKDSDKNKRPSK